MAQQVQRAMGECIAVFRCRQGMLRLSPRRWRTKSGLWLDCIVPGA
jgi:hypothetical protein